MKDYACFLVNSENIVGEDLVDTLNDYLWKVSVLAFIIAGLFHYLTVKKILSPIKDLTIAAKEIKEGKTPSKVEVTTSGELKELIDNFNSMSQTLHLAQEHREEMLRDIAHELRTPLTNINGYLEALQNKVIEGDSELFSSLLEESRRITRIVELITELNSWNNEIFLEKKFEPLAINNVLTESLKAFKLSIEKQFIDMHFNIEEAQILGNKDGIMQVFTNILKNISDYNTGDTFWVKGTLNEETYTITFAHTGQYIDPDKKELIFERFYRLEESRSTKADGAGLGLAIVKSIVTAHKGEIEVNTDGLSHLFQIDFPIL
ncbi:ATP-binding protein [Priestia filamentosa]|uniref:ATP-binding protein n=1 Tax=Priestia filamentosa TaxID=1402861 RepID=UPI00397CE0FA